MSFMNKSEMEEQMTSGTDQIDEKEVLLMERAIRAAKEAMKRALPKAQGLNLENPTEGQLNTIVTMAVGILGHLKVNSGR
jgi:hypothetical protein